MGFRDLMAFGCSIPSEARPLLRARGHSNENWKQIFFQMLRILE